MAYLGQPVFSSPTIDFGFSHPPIIYTNMSLDGLKEHFRNQMSKANSDDEKRSYRRCYEALKFAKTCYCVGISSMKISKDKTGYKLEIVFDFAEDNHMAHFFNRLDDHLNTFA